MPDITAQSPISNGEVKALIEIHSGKSYVILKEGIRLGAVNYAFGYGCLRYSANEI